MCSYSPARNTMPPMQAFDHPLDWRVTHGLGSCTEARVAVSVSELARAASEPEGPASGIPAPSECEKES